MSDLSLKQQMFAGSVASVVTVMLLNPLVVLKIRLQDVGNTSSNLSANNNKTVGSLAKEIYQINGFKGFYAGSKAGLYQSLPSVMLYMTLYERLKKSSDLYLTDLSKKNTGGFILNSNNALDFKYFVPVGVGAVSRFISSTLTLPFELIRTIQAGGVTNIKHPSGSSSSSFISQILLREYGFKSLYYGWTPTVLRDSLFSAIYWGILETSRDKITKLNSSNSFSSSSITFLSASFGSIISAALTHPFDVIKTRRQLSAWNNENISKAHSNPNCKCCSLNRLHLIDTIHCMIKMEGISSLFRGLSLRLFTVVPGSAIAITVYDYVKKINLDFYL